MALERPKFHANERLDVPDLQAATADLISAALTRNERLLTLPEGRAVGGSATSARLLSGFGLTDQGAGVVRIAVGSGIFPLLVDGALSFGALFGDVSPAHYDLDLAAAGNNTYAIYVRLVLEDGVRQNRVFWNATTGAEEIDNVATRRVPTWQAVFRDVTAGIPGVGEYVKIWEATIAAGVLSASDDYRHWIFEGDASSTYNQEWGDGTNDRNADRSSYGAHDIHRFMQLVRRQLSDAIDPVGGKAHYKAITVGLHQLDDQHKTDGNHGDVVADSLTTSEMLLDGDPAVTAELLRHRYQYYTNAAKSVMTGQFQGRLIDNWGFEERGIGHLYTDCVVDGVLAAADLERYLPGWSLALVPTGTLQAGANLNYPGMRFNVPTASDQVTITSKVLHSIGEVGQIMAVVYCDQPTSTSYFDIKMVGTTWTVTLRINGTSSFDLILDDGASPSTTSIGGTPTDGETYVCRLIVHPFGSSSTTVAHAIVQKAGILTPLADQVVVYGGGSPWVGTDAVQYELDAAEGAVAGSTWYLLHRLTIRSNAQWLAY